MARVEQAIPQAVVVLIVVVVRALTSCVVVRVQIFTESLLELFLDELTFLVRHGYTVLELSTDLLLKRVKLDIT